MPVQYTSVTPNLARRYIPSGATFGSGSSTTPTAGRVHLSQIQISSPVIATGITFTNVATIAGNVYVGIYAEGALNTPAGGALLATSISTAHAGANASQSIDFTAPINLSAGVYYLAIEFSDATATIVRGGNTSFFPGALHSYDRGGGYGALTNPCPAVGTNYLNWYGWLNVS